MELGDGGLAKGAPFERVGLQPHWQIWRSELVYRQGKSMIRPSDRQYHSYNRRDVDTTYFGKYLKFRDEWRGVACRVPVLTPNE